MASSTPTSRHVTARALPIVVLCILVSLAGWLAVAHPTRLDAARGRSTASHLQANEELDCLNHLSSWGYGPAWRVALAGTTLLYNSGNVLVIADVSTPGAPVVQSETDLYSFIGDIEVVGTTAYVTTGNSGLRVFDISDPANPSELGSYSAWYSAGGLAVSGSYAYVGTGWGVAVVDVSDPAMMDEVGIVDLFGSFVQMSLSGDYLYVAAMDQDLRVVDVSDPTNPSEVGSIYVSGYTYDVKIVGSIAYLATSTGLEVVDVTDPTSPTSIGSYTSAEKARGVAVSGSYAYLAAFTSGMRVINIATPSSPTEVGYYDTPSEANDVVVASSYAYVADGEEGVRILNVSTPSAPTSVAVLPSEGYVAAVTVAGSYAYLASHYRGLTIIDVSNPLKPTKTGSLDTPGAAFDVVVSGDYAYVADWDSLRIIDISNPASPTEVGSVSSTSQIQAVAVSGNYAYLAAWYSGLRIIDVSNPASPTEVGFYDTDGAAQDVDISGTYAYVADYYDLLIIDVSDPASPTEVSAYECDPVGQSVSVFGTIAFVSSGYAGVDLIDVSDPASPDRLFLIATGGGVAKCAVAGDYLYVAEGYAQLAAFDISDPTNPSEAWYGISGGETVGVAVSGSYVYVADGDGGLGVFTACGSLLCPGITIDSVDAYSCPTIKATVSVTDSGGQPVSGLPADAFFVTEKGGSRDFTLADQGGGQYEITFTTASSPGLSYQFSVLVTYEGCTAQDSNEFYCEAPCFAPTITVQPQSVTIPPGGTTTLSVTATGTEPMYYQWYEGESGNFCCPLAAYSASYTTPPRTDTRKYWAYVSNDCGDAYSDTATVTVMEPTSYDYLVPSVAHWPGKNNTAWRTNLAVTNRTGGPASLTLTYTSYETGATTVVRTYTLAAGASVEWQDVLVSLFGYADSDKAKGSIHISSDVAVLITSRTFNQTLEGTFGQYYPAIDAAVVSGGSQAAQATPGLAMQGQVPATDGFTTSETGNLLQLKKSDDFRSNLGVQNLGTSSVTVSAKLYDASGNQIGSTVTHSIAGNAYWQWDDVFAKAGASSEPLAYAEVQVETAGGEVWAYGSVVDNVTGDPTTIPTLTGPQAGPYLVPSVAHWPGKNNTAWRTNLAVANRNAYSTFLTLTYTSYETGTTTVQRSTTLAAGESVEWQDVLVSLFGYADSDKAKGSIRIESTRPIFITSRTFNQTLEGTFGQYYPAVPYSQGFTSGEVGTVMQLKKTSDFRSNLGVQNLLTSSVDVTVKLYDATGTQVGSTLTHSIAGNAYWQWDDVFAKAGAAAEALAYATVEVATPGGRVWAYGSVVDNVTGDPTTVPVLIQ